MDQLRIEAFLQAFGLHDIRTGSPCEKIREDVKPGCVPGQDLASESVRLVPTKSIWRARPPALQKKSGKLLPLSQRTC